MAKSTIPGMALAVAFASVPSISIGSAPSADADACRASAEVVCGVQPEQEEQQEPLAP